VKDHKRAIAYSSAAALATALSHVLSFGVLALFSLMIFFLSLVMPITRSSLKKASASAAVTSFIILAIALTAAPQIVGYDTVKLFSFINEPFDGALAPSPPRASFVAGLVIGAAGIAYGLLQRGEYSTITTSAGILLILLNFPMIASEWLFRFSLMSSILIPPIAAIIVGEVEEKFRLAAFLLIIGLMAMSAVAVIPMLRPSITMEEYAEIQKISDYIPLGSSLLIPNTKLRYWVEALHDDRYEFLKRAPSQPTQNLYLVIEKKPLMKKPLPRGKIIFEGENVAAIMLGKPPRRATLGLGENFYSGHLLS